jgi:hypothetical protein
MEKSEECRRVVELTITTEIPSVPHLGVTRESIRVPRYQSAGTRDNS